MQGAGKIDGLKILYTQLGLQVDLSARENGGNPSGDISWVASLPLIHFLECEHDGFWLFWCLTIPNFTVGGGRCLMLCPGQRTGSLCTSELQEKT